ncbi:MAG: FMN-binding protein [Clostridia bacterium]|nr:FMN-binding protein [Clostridia bacterium]
MKNSIKTVVVLTVICLIASAALAGVNYITAPVIEANDAAAANAALLEVMPEGGSFTELSLEGLTLPETVTNAYEAANGGYVFRVVTSGYSSGLTVMCGIDPSGAITGAVCLSSGETLGYEKTYGNNFAGLSGTEVDSVDSIGGATRTSEGYKKALKDAYNASIILGGGSVDLRDPAEILQDNLNAALGTEDKTFEKLFITEVIDASVTAVYRCDAGYVVAFGEALVAVGDGAPADTTDNGKIAEATVTALKNSTATAVDTASYELPKAVQGVSVTASGNYIFELRAAGYGIAGEYFASGEYIYIKVAISADGVILDCLTTAQSETENIGDVCADPSYYEQYVGRNSETYKDVDTIAGASEYTAPAYKGAIRQAFEALTILTGGN